VFSVIGKKNDPNKLAKKPDLT